MRNLFKTSVDEEGNSILWWSSRGRLMRVSIYSAAMMDSITEDDLYTLQRRDAEIYLKGFRKGRYG